MANLKNLSLKQIKKEDSQKFKDKKQIVVKDFKLDIDTAIRPSKKTKIVTEALRLTQEKIEKHESVDGIQIITVIYCLIIQNLTSIEVEGLNTFDDYIEMYFKMDDNDYLKPILESLDKEQIEEIVADTNKAFDMWKNELDKLINEDKLEVDSK